MPVAFCVQSNFRPKLFLPEYGTEKHLNWYIFTTIITFFVRISYKIQIQKFLCTLEVHTKIKLHTCTLIILLLHTRDLFGNCHTLQSGAGDLSFIQIAGVAVFVSLNNSSIISFCCYENFAAGTAAEI